MKTKLILMMVAALVLVGCQDEQAEARDPATDKLITETQTMLDEFEVKNLDRLASMYLGEVKMASFAFDTEDGAREALAAQRTAGGAALKQMDYTEAKKKAEEARKEIDDARDALEKGEDQLRAKGFKWEEATYSVAIGNYQLELDQKRRAHRLARTSEERSRLHQEWLDFHDVTLDQIKSGEY